MQNYLISPSPAILISDDILRVPLSPFGQSEAVKSKRSAPVLSSQSRPVQALSALSPVPCRPFLQQNFKLHEIFLKQSSHNFATNNNNMDTIFLGIIIFLFILAIFDLSVGVSNDAVNFLNSAIGSKAAPFRTILIVASIGVFIGAASSNGMMDIARHGIFRPEYFSFYDLICIFMAVMVTDIILLDIFNSLGLPTSTTVSMVFELLGAAFIVAVIKMWSDPSSLSIMDLLNTEKALSVILGIFLSVAIAFVFGTIVQFLTRTLFSFNYKSKLKWKIGLFGGFASTALLYFLLLKGVKDMSWVTPDFKQWINTHTLTVLGCSFVVLTILMQILHALRVNVFKIVVLIGTFSLAMAFAGNDLVNFIGVPLSGFAAWQDYSANGAGDIHGYTMNSLNGPANTPLYFLIAAGCIMVVALATSKKCRNVSKTEIGLGSQHGGEELFSSSRIGRRIVRIALSLNSWCKRWMPARMLRWLDSRFDTTQTITEDGASFDLIRGAVNLMLAGMLIAVGTSLKLPLSTTFVTFMVAMGTSLADRAWGRESAVFRITGVISVIGGWFITAGVAFMGAALIAAIMHWGGTLLMIAIAAIAVVIIIRSNLKFKNKEEAGDTMFQTILSTTDRNEAWELLKVYIALSKKDFLKTTAARYIELTDALISEDARTLSRLEKVLYKEKGRLKSIRRKETVCLRQIPAETAIEASAWFHMINNMSISITYNLRRISEACREHVENNFHPLPASYREEFMPLRALICEALEEGAELMQGNSVAGVARLRLKCDHIKDLLSEQTHAVYSHVRNGNPDRLAITYVYLNMLQESQDLISSLRKLLRAAAKLSDASVNVRGYLDLTPAL